MNGDDTIPRRAPSTTDVEVDGEPVLLDRRSGSLHVLNEVGAAIWARLDGSRTVGEIVAELSEAFEATTARVAPDVHQFLAQLARLGLVDGLTSGGENQLASQTSNGGSWNLEVVWVDWYTAQVVDAFRSNGLESILLKGPAIRSWLYRDAPGERGYLDADLLIPGEGLGIAEAVLSELGFAREDSGESTSRWAESWRRLSDGAVVDLHRTLQGCEHSAVDPWPILRAGAVQGEVGGAKVLLPSIAARTVEVVLISPADRPWHKWQDLERAQERLPAEVWREAAALANALGVERQFGYRLSQSAAGAAAARRIGVPAAPEWWLRWEADPMLRWVALLAEVPGWRARTGLARQLMKPPAGYSTAAWAMHILRLVPGAVLTLLRTVLR